jgi:hypothetical protein
MCDNDIIEADKALICTKCKTLTSFYNRYGADCVGLR